MKKYSLLYCFFIFLLGVTLMDIFNNDKIFSELENRKLNSKINFSIKGYFDGSYPKKYESYMSDQFFLRNNWISLKSRSEYLLGKLENNGIIYGKEDYLFEKVTEYSEDRYNKNTMALNTFINEINTPVSLLISPTSFGIYKDYLPKGVPLISQKDLLKSLKESFKNGNYIDLEELFDNKKDEEIFYRTDHHWTTLGAYYAYVEFMNSIGEVPVLLENLNEISVEGFYGTFFSKAKPFNIDGDILTYYQVPKVSMRIEEQIYNTLYDTSKLELRDKYAMFLYGNNPLTIIENKGVSNGKKIVIFKDSYANSLVPFLSLSFEEIHVIDLRTFNISPIEYVNSNEFDEVIINYNIVNYTRDANLIKFKS